MSDTHDQHNVLAGQKILNDVKVFGCHFGLIEADNYLPAFAYSIGLYKTFKHPEIVCFGLSLDALSFLLNQVKRIVQRGEKLKVNQPYQEFLEGYDIQFIEVNKAFYPDYFGYANWFYDYKDDYSVLQLVWTDKKNRYPWDDEFDPELKRFQPLLDRNMDFKFQESRNLGVYTTKQVIDGAPILYVYHNADGNWQFHNSSEPYVEDAMLVSLETITKLDPSVNQIYFLQYSWRAWRESTDEKWSYEESEVEE